MIRPACCSLLSCSLNFYTFVGMLVRLMALLPGQARAGLCLSLPSLMAQSLAQGQS